MKLVFNYKEKTAIYKVAKMMAEADGIVLHQETKSIEDEIRKMGDIKYEKLLCDGEKLETIDALRIIYGMDALKKKFISSMLGYFISVDDDIADAEMALWTFIIKVCNLPKMNIRQAIAIYKTF